MNDQSIKFETRNSVYEVDLDNMKIRRLESNHKPTNRQSDDGVWDDIADISNIQEGQEVLIVWPKDQIDDYTEGTIPCTHTSEVQAVHTQQGVDGS